MTDNYTPFDTRLERALGAGSLSPEQRRRHLDRIAARSSAGRFSPGRLLRDGAVVVILIALLAGAWAMLPMGDSDDVDPMTALAAMKEEISEPEPGTARYIEIGVLGIVPGNTTGMEEFTVRAWERWTEDGSAERAIHNYSGDGELVGRVVVLTDRTIYETPGNLNEAASGIDMHPPELFQPIAAVEASEPSELFDQLEQILEEDGVNVEDEGDGNIRVWMLSPESPPEDTLTMYEQELGVQATGWGVEHLIDTEANQRLEWRVYVEDDEGEHHTIQQYLFDGWHEIDEQDIPEDAFAEQTELSEQALGIPLPLEIDHSMGTLQMIDGGRGSSSGTMRYRGPDPILLEISYIPADAEHAIADQPESERSIEIDGIEGHWIVDPEQDWPRVAIWSDSELTYSLHARNLPEDGWTEDDLYELISAISLD